MTEKKNATLLGVNISSKSPGTNIIIKFLDDDNVIFADARARTETLIASGTAPVDGSTGIAEVQCGTGKLSFVSIAKGHRSA